MSLRKWLNVYRVLVIIALEIKKSQRQPNTTLHLEPREIFSIPHVRLHKMMFVYSPKFAFFKFTQSCHFGSLGSNDKKRQCLVLFK